MAEVLDEPTVAEASWISAADHQRLREWLSTRDGRTAIVGGHFMLGHDREHGRLAPLILEDLTARPDLAADAASRAGGFPGRTWRCALDLMADEPDAESRVALLVNDHHFTQFLPDESKSEASVAGLRRAYFRDDPRLPESYERELQARRLDQSSVLVLNQRESAQKQDILPKASLFFSEQALRNRFGNRTRNELLQHEGFWQLERNQDEQPSLFWDPPGRYEVFCLTDAHGGCGCLGEIVELIVQLTNLGYANVLLLIPQECKREVTDAARAAHYGIGCSNSVAVVTGIGGKNEAVVPKPSFHLQVFD